MSDSLLERFAAVAPVADPDWADVRRRARRGRIRLPLVAAAALAALVVAAPAVGLVALLKDSAPAAMSVWITVTPPGTHKLTGVVRGAVDGSIRTVALELDGRPRREQAVSHTRTFFFRLSSRDFGRCGTVYGIDTHGYPVAAISLPYLAVPTRLPPANRVVVAPPKPC